MTVKHTPIFTHWIWRRLFCANKIRYNYPGRDLDTGYCLDRYSIERDGVVVRSAP